MHNPYAPPESAETVSRVSPHAKNQSMPMIPALIGLFTYGSSSPYALVLCVEHYLRPNSRPIPWAIHIATVLAIFGTVAWFAFAIVCSSPVFDLFKGEPASIYTQLALMVWLATVVFFVWMFWRIARFRRQPTNP